MRILLGGLILAGGIWAQPVVAPTPEPAGSARGDNAGPYNITNSFEIGYRFKDVDGNTGKYRSDVNFGNGIRLLSGTMGVHTRDGKGKFFDELLLDLRGLGNDPYQFSSFRMQKNSLYRYDMMWRENEYFNPALTISGGQHLLSTSRKLQDHDLVLLPQSKLKFRMGYSRNSQGGPGLWTGQWFDGRGDEYSYFANVRREQNEYRVGGDLDIGRVKLTVMRGWEFFKDDTNFGRNTPTPGANTSDRNTLSSLRRDEPMHGSTPYWRAHLHSQLSRQFSVHGRFTHSSGRRDFLFDEFASGTDRLGAARNRQILVSGTGTRPVTTGHFTVSLQPDQKWSFANQTGYHQARMEGNGRYGELNNGTVGLELVSFEHLGIRNVSNTSDASWQPLKQAGVFGSFHVSERRIRSNQLEDIAPIRAGAPIEQTNRNKAGIFGVRLQPTGPLRILFSAEVGRNDKPFYPTSDKDYTAYVGRVSYRTKKYQLSSDFRTFNNTNSTSLFVHSSEGRTWAGAGTWSPRTNVQFDAGYSYQHLNTLTGLAYFADFNLVESSKSYYLTNLHTIHAGGQVQIRKRADVYAGFVRTQDRADGRRTPDAGSRANVVSDPSTIALLTGAQVFPVSFQSPLARVSVVIRNNLRWNFGWQYYDYREKFLSFQDYSAHTGYVSLSYSF
ncbi:MAG: hypothetical protein FJW30_22930 [Acidobacteria bacterium]|nr:hypothetical protein [Acidobacteriota bacterium]